MNDVKAAAFKTTCSKWQHQWDISDRGRHFYSLKPKVNLKSLLDFPDPTSSKLISQLRLGYNRLNSYSFNIGISDTDKCKCGEKETVEHFLLQCPLYSDAREELRREMWRQTGCLDLTLGTILHREQDEQTNTPKQDTKTCYVLLAKYISQTARFL